VADEYLHRIPPPEAGIISSRLLAALLAGQAARN
jgi:hypothetical protein